jgi:hypothetical protein
MSSYGIPRDSMVMFEMQTSSGTSALDMNAFWGQTDSFGEEGSADSDIWQGASGQNDTLDEKEVLFAPGAQWEVVGVRGGTGSVDAAYAAVVTLKAVE